MKTRLIERLTELSTAAFGLVAALAWNDAIRSLFIGPCEAENAGPLCEVSTHGPWFYAIFVTILAVIVTLQIARAAEKAKSVHVRNAIKAKLSKQKQKLSA